MALLTKKNKEARLALEAQREQVRQEIRRSGQLSVPFIVMNSLATVVACYGLFANSTAVVIGAMIIAMLLGPITGIALALVEGDAALLRRAILAEVVGAATVFAIAFLLGKMHADFPFTEELRARTSPNLLDLVIALAGGAAGAYAQVSPRISLGLVGVAIATALVPPLSTSAISLARGELRMAGAAFVLFFTNLVAIELANALVLWLHGYHLIPPRELESPMDRRLQRLRNAFSVTLLLTLTVFLGINFSRTLERQRFEREVRSQLASSLRVYPGAHLTDLSIRWQGGRVVVSAGVRTPASLTPLQVAALERRLPVPSDGPIELHVLSVLIKEAVRDGYLHQLDTIEQQKFNSGLESGL